MKRLLTYILTAMLLGAVLPASAQLSGDWKLYSSFNNYYGSFANTFIIRQIDTPSHLYVQYRTQAQSPIAWFEYYANKYSHLYVYDKGADEILHFNKRNYLSENIVNTIAYNPERGYLLIAYDNSNIDLLFDNGDVKNVSGLASASLNEDKKINEVTFDPANNKAYIGTEFGYIVIDDKKFEISESKIFRKSIKNIGRVGDWLVAFDDSKVYTSPVNGDRVTFADFREVTAAATPSELMILGGNKFAYKSGKAAVYVAEIGSDGNLASNTQVFSETVMNVSPWRNGWTIGGTQTVFNLDKDGNKSNVLTYDAADKNMKFSSYDGVNYWVGNERKGFSCKKHGDSGWTVTKGNIAPNQPAPFIARNMAYNDTYGMLVCTHGKDGFFQLQDMRYPGHMSALKNGTWSHFGPVETNPTQANALIDPNCLVVDPDNDKYVYTGSWFRGVVRLNLEDPADILHMSTSGDDGKSLGTFQEIAPVDNSYRALCLFKNLAFDNDGNLWASHYNSANGKAGIGHIYVWPSQYRKAGQGAGKWVDLQVNDDKCEYYQMVLPLCHPDNKNLVIYLSGRWNGPITIYDHKGTLSDTSDDKIYYMPRITDQDGNTVNKNRINHLFEDPDTGNVWVLTTGGLFWFNPTQAKTNPTSVTRVKVARNDGTNLADYLLDNIAVLQMTVDGQGRKWFATQDAGLVCTSADGKEVLGEFTTDNSYIPSNLVVGVAYNKENNSIMVGTEKGIAEFFASGSTTSDDMDSVKVYPNPVRPDYLGYVTVSGLPDGSLVKITDANGNIVKELGLSSGGTVRWDATNIENKRVRSGVYYVLGSSGPGDSNLSAKTKILVVN